MINLQSDYRTGGIVFPSEENLTSVHQRIRMSGNEDSSDYRLDREDYPYFTEDEFNTFRVGEKKFVEEVHLKCKKRFEKRIANYSLQPVKGKMDLNIVTCGKAGCGKSSTANSIIGRKAFTVSSSSNSITQVSLDNTCTYRNRRITVVDTPGVFATDFGNATVKKDLTRMAFLLKGGVHCFIICVSTSDTRFTKDMEEMLELIKLDGRGDFFDYCMLTYTKAETELETCTLRQFLEQKKENDRNRRFLEKINDRVVAVNNNCLVPAEALRNRDALINMVDVVVADNIRRGNPVIFTNDLFEKAGKLQDKLTGVVGDNNFHQVIVNATIEVIINNYFARLPFDKFLKEVTSIIRERKRSEKIPDVTINGTDRVDAEYINQVHKIYDEIQPELNMSWRDVRFITLATAAATGAATGVAGGAVGVVAGAAVGIISALYKS